MRGQTELLPGFWALITLLNFPPPVIQPEMHVNGAELGSRIPPSYETPDLNRISRFDDRKSLATMIRLDTKESREHVYVLGRWTRPRRHLSSQHVLSGGKTNN